MAPVTGESLIVARRTMSENDSPPFLAERRFS